MSRLVLVSWLIAGALLLSRLIHGLLYLVAAIDLDKPGGFLQYLNVAALLATSFAIICTVSWLLVRRGR